MPTIPDFTESEIWTVRTSLRERYGRDLDFELADSEIRLRPHARAVSTCPTVYWHADGCNFVIFKTGDRRYRCQFYYRVHEQFGTGVDEYDDLGECAVTLLQIQADHQSERQGQFADYSKP
jgi:hypothetical protein